MLTSHGAEDGVVLSPRRRFSCPLAVTELHLTVWFCCHLRFLSAFYFENCLFPLLRFFPLNAVSCDPDTQKQIRAGVGSLLDRDTSQEFIILRWLK